MLFNGATNSNLNLASGFFWRSIGAVFLAAIICTILFAYHQQIIVLNFHSNFGIAENSIHIENFQTFTEEKTKFATKIFRTTKKPKIFNKIPLILMWTPVFGQFPELSAEFAKCPKLICKYSTEKSEAKKAAAFIYHMRDFNWNMVLPSRSPDQYHVFYLQESPVHTYVDLKKWPNYCKNSNTSTKNILYQNEEIQYCTVLYMHCTLDLMYCTVYCSFTVLQCF